MTTGWPPGLLQDDERKLSRWLASRPDALYQLRKNMTQEDIIAMAREAELHCHVKLTENGLFIEDLKHFAALVIEHYKDECGHELNEAIKQMQERGLGQ